MQAIKQHKMQSNVQANSIPEWQYDQEVKQARKASKGLRMQRKTRKGFWQSGE